MNPIACKQSNGSGPSRTIECRRRVSSVPIPKTTVRR